MYVPSELEEDDRPEDQEEDVHKGRPVVGDCEPLKQLSCCLQGLSRTNSAMSVKRALQDIVLYLESFGLPVYRLHSDHAKRSTIQYALGYVIVESEPHGQNPASLREWKG